MSEEKRRLVLIDGFSLLHRAYHAFPMSLKTSSGQLVNAVYGFTKMFLAVIKELKPDYLVVAMDRPEPTFRHKAYEEYKIHRPPTPEDLTSQINPVKEVVEVFKVPILEKAGFEADDVIGTLAKRACQNSKFQIPNSKLEIVIVTGDRDMLQLVGGQVKIYFPKNKSGGNFFDEEALQKEYGLKPEQMVDLKAMVGDPADHIPGVFGIGPKTAMALLHKHGSLEEIYKNLSKISPKIAEKLRENEAMALMSKKLAKIEIKVPLQFDLQECQFGNYDEKEVRELFRHWEFKSLLKQLPSLGGEQIRLI